MPDTRERSTPGGGSQTVTVTEAEISSQPDATESTASSFEPFSGEGHRLGDTAESKQAEDERTPGPSENPEASNGSAIKRFWAEFIALLKRLFSGGAPSTTVGVSKPMRIVTADDVTIEHSSHLDLSALQPVTLTSRASAISAAAPTSAASHRAGAESQTGHSNDGVGPAKLNPASYMTLDVMHSSTGRINGTVNVRAVDVPADVLLELDVDDLKSVVEAVNTATGGHLYTALCLDGFTLSEAARAEASQKGVVVREAGVAAHVVQADIATPETVGKAVVEETYTKGWVPGAGREGLAAPRPRQSAVLRADEPGKVLDGAGVSAALAGISHPERLSSLHVEAKLDPSAAAAIDSWQAEREAHGLSPVSLYASLPIPQPTAVAAPSSETIRVQRKAWLDRLESTSPVVETPTITAKESPAVTTKPRIGPEYSEERLARLTAVPSPVAEPVEEATTVSETQTKQPRIETTAEAAAREARADRFEQLAKARPQLDAVTQLPEKAVLAPRTETAKEQKAREKRLAAIEKRLARTSTVVESSEIVSAKMPEPTVPAAPRPAYLEARLARLGGDVPTQPRIPGHDVEGAAMETASSRVRPVS